MHAPTSSDRPGRLLASGGSAQIFAWGARHVLKLYLSGAPAALPAAEAARTSAVRAAGAPAPLVLETVSVSGRHGVVFERVEGPTMLEALLARPHALDEFAAQLAALHVALHGLAAAPLPPLRERLRARIEHCAALPPARRAQLVQLADRLQPGTALCHGDFHPGNVILGERGPLIIDWYDAASGAADADFARSLLLVRHASVPGAGHPAVDQVRAAFHAAYARHYQALRPVDVDSLRAWTLVAAAARLAEAPTSAERARLADLIEHGMQAT
jgi:aminoglycoside phosphotransferase (APT) family kinase protein